MTLLSIAQEGARLAEKATTNLALGSYQSNNGGHLTYPDGFIENRDNAIYVAHAANNHAALCRAVIDAGDVFNAHAARAKAEDEASELRAALLDAEAENGRLREALKQARAEIVDLAGYVKDFDDLPKVLARIDAALSAVRT